MEQHHHQREWWEENQLEHMAEESRGVLGQVPGKRQVCSDRSRLLQGSRRLLAIGQCWFIAPVISWQNGLQPVLLWRRDSFSEPQAQGLGCPSYDPEAQDHSHLPSSPKDGRISPCTQVPWKRVEEGLKGASCSGEGKSRLAQQHR